jgi:hypothetical protein
MIGIGSLSRCIWMWRARCPNSPEAMASGISG